MARKQIYKTNTELHPTACRSLNTQEPEADKSFYIRVDSNGASKPSDRFKCTVHSTETVLHIISTFVCQSTEELHDKVFFSVQILSSGFSRRVVSRLLPTLQKNILLLSSWLKSVRMEMSVQPTEESYCTS